MGGPYRAYKNINNKMIVEDISKLDARSTSIQWTNVRYSKEAQERFYKMAKRPTKDKLGDYDIDTALKSGDLNTMDKDRSSKMYMYQPGERYNSMTGEFEDVTNELSEDKAKEIRQKQADIEKDLVEKAKNAPAEKTQGKKPLNYHVSGSRFMKNKPGYFVDKTSIQRMTTAENIQKQTGLASIDELNQYFEEVFEERGIESDAEKAEIRETFDAMMNGRNIYPDLIKTADQSHLRDPKSVIEQASDPEFRENYKKVCKTMDDIDKQYAARERTGLSVDSTFIRATGMLMDISGTKEAEEHNIQMMEMANCKAGQALLGTENVQKLLNQGFDKFVLKDDNATMKVIAEQGTDIELGFLTVNGAFGVNGMEIDPLVAQEYEFNKTVYESGVHAQSVGAFYKYGGAGLYDPEKFADSDIANIVTSKTTDKKSAARIYDGFISHLDRNRKPGFLEATAELTQKGIIGKDSKYINAMMTTKDADGKEITQRIKFSEAIDKYGEILAAKKNPNGPQPDFKIEFVEKTPEEKKAIDAAYSNPAKVKPVPNPGALYGQGLQDDFKELSNNIKGLDIKNAQKVPSFASTLKKINELSSKKYDTQEKGLEQLRDLSKQIRESIKEIDRGNTLKGEDKHMALSILRTAKELSEEKIGYNALEKYTKSKGLDISKMYSDKTIAKSDRTIEKAKTEKAIQGFKPYGKKDIASDVQKYKGGKLTSEQLAESVAAMLAKNDLNKGLKAGMTQEDIDAYRKTITKENFEKGVNGYLEGTGKQALATAIESLSPKQLDALGKGSLQGKDLEDFMEAYQYSQQLLSPEYQQAMEEEAKRAEEEFAKEQTAKAEAEAKAKEAQKTAERDDTLNTGLRRLNESVGKAQNAMTERLEDTSKTFAEKRPKLERDLATMMTAKTMSQTLENVGQHMSNKDIKEFLSHDTRMKAREDLLKDPSFKQLCSTLGEDDYKQLACDPDKLDKCMGDLQKIDTAKSRNKQQEPEKQQQAPKKQQQGPSK